MISVDEAQAVIFNAIPRARPVDAPLDQAAGRVLASPVTAKLTQPPFTASAMDGYAVSLDDVRKVGARLRVVGVSSAGERFVGKIISGQAVRIYTGAPMPEGANHVIIQESITRDADAIIVNVAQTAVANVRQAGVDFKAGDILLSDGVELTGPALALAAAGNIAALTVYERPRVALIANGDELTAPGTTLYADKIICSIPYGLGPMISAWGGDADFLGIAPDDPERIKTLVDKALDYDLIVPIGGASVGDKDYMRRVFAESGFVSKFEKVSVKPGKPAWFGFIGETPVVGLPGNPASALVTAMLFVKPAIKARFGQPKDQTDTLKARLTKPLAANGSRESYLRAKLSPADDSGFIVTPHANQDSSLLSIFARSDVLIRRQPYAAAATEGALVECLPI